MRSFPYLILDPLRTVASPLSLALAALLGARFVPPVAAESAAVAPTLTQANQDFAVRLFRELGKSEGNLFFSPYSVSSLLALADAGARGRTAAELSAALGITLPPTQLALAYGDLAGKLAADSGPGMQLTVAHSLWVQRDFPLQPEFLDLARQQFQAELQPVDFNGDPGAACREINAWVERATAGKIENIVSPDGLSPATRAILCDAVYFKGRWQKPFPARGTRPERFFLTPQQSVLTPLMTETGRLRMAEEDGFRLAELHYASGTVSMIILLPNSPDGLSAVESQLTPGQLRTWLADLDAGPYFETTLSLPKFTQNWSGDLARPLGELGVKEAFGSAADFSGISAKERLYISQLLHKSYVKVDEEGTEAAAATSMTFGIAAIVRPQEVFRVDHPFLYLIRENATGTVLFMGRMVDPR